MWLYFSEWFCFVNDSINWCAKGEAPQWCHSIDSLPMLKTDVFILCIPLCSNYRISFLSQRIFLVILFYLRVKHTLWFIFWSLPFAVDAVPCRIAFERGKERHFSFLALSMGASGWLVLAEESPLKQHFGVVRVSAPLAGSNVSITSMSPCIFVFIFGGRASMLPFRFEFMLVHLKFMAQMFYVCKTFTVPISSQAR